MQRFKMNIEFVHHELSGWQGEAEVRPTPDAAGEWVRADVASDLQEQLLKAYEPFGGRPGPGESLDVGEALLRHILEYKDAVDTLSNQNAVLQGRLVAIARIADPPDAEPITDEDIPL